MRTVDQEPIFTHFIAQEMREASRGSFPLSPGIMTGHYAVGNLYWHYRKGILLEESITGIFGREDPEPPVLTVPEGHITLHSTDGLNRSVWKDFLQKAFVARPEVDPQQEVRTLISTNADIDNRNFATRMERKKSRLVLRDEPTPSLLRAFLYEGAFPERNAFFSWLLSEMREEVSGAMQDGFQEPWSKNLGALVSTWDRNFQDIPFAPELPR